MGERKLTAALHNINIKYTIFNSKSVNKILVETVKKQPLFYIYTSNLTEYLRMIYIWNIKLIYFVWKFTMSKLEA